MKKALAILISICMLGTFACAEGMETAILLDGDAILVNGEPIPMDANAMVYLAYKNEAHEDVPEEYAGLENRVITITEGGSYRISGSADDVQIAVRAGEEDEVRLILDGADIGCRTAPAIAVFTAKDARVPSEYAVTIEAADGSMNKITGSHTEEIQEGDIKLSGAITSLVSVGFEGEGSLIVEGDNEGIEVKFGHMTFNGGRISVRSGDDPLNASEDGVSAITINDGSILLHVKPEKGGEGDGVDSNGSIVVNGGALMSYAHPDSMDSGIDSDLGCTINGGTVLGVGNMYDEISADSGQLFMALQFVQKTDEMIVITDMNGTPVLIANADATGSGYTSFVLSSPLLQEGDYQIYLGGELTEVEGETQYTPGRQLQHGGAFSGGLGHRGGERPEMPRGTNMPEPPEGMNFSGDMPIPPLGGFNPGKMPGGRDFGGNAGQTELSTVFHLAPGSTMFGNITEMK